MADDALLLDRGAIMNPGMSARKSSGMLKALQVAMKRAALSARIDEEAPPLLLRLVGDPPDDLTVDPAVTDGHLLAHRL